MVALVPRLLMAVQSAKNKVISTFYIYTQEVWILQNGYSTLSTFGNFGRFIQTPTFVDPQNSTYLLISWTAFIICCSTPNLSKTFFVEKISRPKYFDRWYFWQNVSFLMNSLNCQVNIKTAVNKLVSLIKSLDHFPA